MSNENLLVIQEHTVNGLDSGFCRFCTVIVNEAISPGASAFVSGDLTRENVSKGSKGIMKSLGQRLGMRDSGASEKCRGNFYLVVDLLVKVLDENVALARLAEGWVSLRPHDTAGGDRISWEDLQGISGWGRTRLCP